MRARANTRVTILRGSETDSYGDEVDSATVAHTGVPAWLFEGNRRQYVPAENATRIVRNVTCRVTAGTDVQPSDRIRDEMTGLVYQILELNDNPGSPVHRPDVVLQLSRTS